MKIKKYLTIRVMLVIFFLIISLIVINPAFNVKGVAIKSIKENSTAANAGMANPETDIQLRNKEYIISINEKEVVNVNDYSKILDEVKDNTALKILTNKKEYIMLKTDNIGINIEERASTNIRKGLDLQGGTRAVMEPEEKLSDEQIANVIKNMELRLGRYGLSDMSFKPASDLTGGKKYIIVEVAGASQEEVRSLLEKQGKFEGKIGNETVFIGGERDIVWVCQESGTCSGIRNCDEAQGGYYCSFEFQIKLSKEAADRQADATRNLDINITASGQKYLSKPLDLYLDDQLMDSLQIAADLKGMPATDIVISGPGLGATEQDALNDANKNMNVLQTILITGILPTKMSIVKIDTISANLGEVFVKNAWFVGLLAVLAVAVVIFIRYRSLKVAIPILLTDLSEIFILLGIAALIRWNLDLASIAGIIAAVGTGVDDQIVITDETMRGREGGYYNWKERFKRAFFIIIVAYFTNVAAMLPLFKAGAGLLTGFAFTTIVGVSIGVFITRPAYGEVIGKLLQD